MDLKVFVVLILRNHINFRYRNLRLSTVTLACTAPFLTVETKNIHCCVCFNKNEKKRYAGVWLTPAEVLLTFYKTLRAAESGLWGLTP